ncbi:MAG: chitinase, partial [Bacteroidota bacterium]
MTRSTKLVFSFLMLFILSLNSNGQVPDPALIGYWHNWNTIIAAYVPLDSVDSRYNVINVAFAVPKTGTICDMEFVPYKVNQSTFKAQVDTVRSQGRKVLISIGGGGTLVELKDTNQRKVFVSSVLKIIDTYGFDGIDIDLESGSVTVSGGTIANPVDSKIINLISAIKQISSEYRNKYGRKMMLTMAPETAGVTGGMSKYEGEWGAYLPVIDALRDSIDILHMQLYNSGTMYGIDGKIYTQGTVDFLISQTDAVLRGFDTDGGHFAGLKPEQIAIGMPACVSAAEGGYMNLISVKWSILYLLGKSQQPGEYSLDYKYPTLRGMMTW